LEQDIKFKLKFYYTKNASYETAHFGTLRLVPCADAIKDLSIDYEHMKDMIYGEKPLNSDASKAMKIVGVSTSDQVRYAARL
jgi:hypothetical protein